MIPLAIKEVREAAGTNMNELVEDSGNDCLVVDLEVKTGVS